MNIRKGILRIGISRLRLISPVFKPRIPPRPVTVVQVIKVANPKPEVGITNGRVMISSSISLP